MNFHIAKVANQTGRFLQNVVDEKLRELNVRDNPNAHICYGVGYTRGGAVLNGNCSARTKLAQSVVLQEGLGPGALEVFGNTPAGIRHAKEFVGGGGILLARNLVHAKGKDIKIIVEPWQVDAAIGGGAAFFTKYEKSDAEFRTWVYRKRHLGSYEKVLRRPQDFKRIGRNHDNGFDFSGLERENVPGGLKDVAKRAIRCLNLDFGAVDIIRSGNRYIVLEVNAAPGVSDERRTVLQQLGHRIVRWVANGCPQREN